MPNKQKPEEPATLETVGVHNKGRIKSGGSPENRFYVRTKGEFGKSKKLLSSCDPEFTTRTFSGVFINAQAEAFAHKGAFVLMANGGREPSKRLKRGSPAQAPPPKKAKDSAASWR